VERFETEGKARVLLDVAGGPITLNVQKKLKLDDGVTMEIVGQGSTRDITLNVLQHGTIKVDEKAVVRGTLNAPYAKVEFKEKSRLYGAVSARKIELDEDVHFEPHPPGE
jgi:hypothetical protein